MREAENVLVVVEKVVYALGFASSFAEEVRESRIEGMSRVLLRPCRCVMGASTSRADSSSRETGSPEGNAERCVCGPDNAGVWT